MKDVKNSVYLEGLLYDHKLEKKVSGPNSKNPGTEFIRGSIRLATDEKVTNIVEVRYVYVTPVTKKGAENRIYTVLTNILNGTYGSVMSDGVDKATKLSVNTSIGLNEFYVLEGAEERLVSQKINNGGFITVLSSFRSPEENRSRFEVDMFVTGTTRKEADEERGLPEKLILKGCVFDGFSKSMLPVEFSVLKPAIMNYFEGLEISSKNPVFVPLKGSQVSTTVIRKKEEEMPWGEVIVTEVPHTNKDYVIDWSQKPYDFGDEKVLTPTEVSEMRAKYEVHINDLKQQFRDRQMNKAVVAAVQTDDVYDF